ncbi:MAG: hypothetical protein Q8R28_02175 [Dehalococcoidia bacterium]|nr:hypothetical protein [Dehalococcoidia bacterium]
MRVEEVRDEADRFVDWLHTRNAHHQQVRETDGLYHISSLIRSVYVESGLAAKQSKNYGLDGKQDDPSLRFEFGYVWEEMLTDYFRSRIQLAKLGIERPEPIVVGDMVCSPDGLDAGGCLYEYKATLTGPKPPGDYWTWMHQIRAGCWFAQTDHAELWVWHLAGDWRPPSPFIRRVRLWFEGYELDETFRMLAAQRDREHKKKQEVAS